MALTFGERLKHSWNAFMNKDPTETKKYIDLGPSNTRRPDMFRPTRGTEKTIVTAIYTRIAMDVAQLDIEHVKVDDNGRYIETIKSGLNYALTTEANIDQTGRAFIQDIVMSMFDEGCVAIVPVDTTFNPLKTGSYDIQTMRVGTVVEWFPQYVKVRLYNDKTGKHSEVTLPKKMVAIIENPLYAVMNEPNSVAKRLIRKLSILDAVDEQSGSGKLDLIIGLPYVIKTEARREQAERRRKDIEQQLSGSKYGIAYTDGTEHITQLNRSVENNMWTQIQDLTEMLYNQLGMTKGVFDGTASEAEMLNYQSRTIEPIVSAITEEMSRKFLTKTARSQKQTIMFFKDPFSLTPTEKIADIADKFTRNAILSSNEMRAIIGYKPVDDQRADELSNKNINQSTEEMQNNPIVTDSGNSVGNTPINKI
ncbi:MAG: phage portal protein [Bacilli bacterium]|nr:phage portal protein [Bacilli bacterium]